MTRPVSLLAVRETAATAYPDLKWQVTRPFDRDELEIVAEGEVRVGRSTYPTRVTHCVSGLELARHANVAVFVAGVIERVAQQAKQWP